MASCCFCYHPNTDSGQAAEVFGATSLIPFKVERFKRERESQIKPSDLRACARCVIFGFRPSWQCPLQSSLVFGSLVLLIMSHRGQGSCHQQHCRDVWYLIVPSALFFFAVLDHCLYNTLQMEKWKHVVNNFQTWDRSWALCSQLCPGSAALVSPLARSTASTEAKCRSIESNLLCSTGQSFVLEENFKQIYH